jgi:hypothetical protein
MTTATRAGQAGLQGWRGKLADRVAEPVAKRSRFDEDQVRAVMGATFLALSVLYVLKSALVLTRETRRG